MLGWEWKGDGAGGEDGRRLAIAWTPEMSKTWVTASSAPFVAHDPPFASSRCIANVPTGTGPYTNPKPGWKPHAPCPVLAPPKTPQTPQAPHLCCQPHKFGLLRPHQLVRLPLALERLPRAPRVQQHVITIRQQPVHSKRTDTHRPVRLQQRSKPRRPPLPVGARGGRASRGRGRGGRGRAAEEAEGGGAWLGAGGGGGAEGIGAGKDGGVGEAAGEDACGLNHVGDHLGRGRGTAGGREGASEAVRGGEEVGEARGGSCRGCRSFQHVGDHVV